tara:strand:- start:232 stop:834 length:603 start_codon:yes stop_codon:yes gene_type:complete
MNSEILPIFPLRSIVLPGGLFPLRIFERRYLDMVAKCIKDDKGFCIALVKKESSNNYITDVYEYGSHVKIADWNKLPDGLLGITVEGRCIVKILNSSLDKNGLLNGEINTLEFEKQYLVPQKYRALSDFYRKISPGLKDFIAYKQEKYSDASWLSYRLTECLPIDLQTKADLIATNNSLERLEKINSLMQKLYNDEMKNR